MSNPYARPKPEKQGWWWPALEFVPLAAAAAAVGAAAYLILI